MPLFQCSKCGCIENTALCNYWFRGNISSPVCSACDPEINKWHGSFEKKNAKGMLIDTDGFLYYKDEDKVNSNVEIIGKVI